MNGPDFMRQASKNALCFPVRLLNWWRWRAWQRLRAPLFIPVNFTGQLHKDAKRDNGSDCNCKSRVASEEGGARK